MSDKYDRLRYIGYCWAKLPPDDEDVVFEDFLNYAKFQLCRASQRLMKDPIWEEYTAEEILVEYYGLLFHQNEKRAKDFIMSINGVSSSDYDWIIEQSEKEDEDQLGKEEDNVSFTPEEIGEG